MRLDGGLGNYGLAAVALPLISSGTKGTLMTDYISPCCFFPGVDEESSFVVLPSSSKINSASLFCGIMSDDERSETVDQLGKIPDKLLEASRFNDR